MITLPSAMIGEALVPNSTTGAGSGFFQSSLPLQSYASTP